jgi:hypothetical protein
MGDRREGTSRSLPALIPPIGILLESCVATSGGLNMACVGEYRQYAAELIRIAQQTQNSNDKATLLDMAQRWRELAEKLEREEGQRR